MKIEPNSRQMPSVSNVVAAKDYCDLLYAWLQCNSEKAALKGDARRIEKKRVKWAAIEKDFTRTLSDGTVEKAMGRKTIAKYFLHLLNEGLVEDRGDDYYYITVLDAGSAYLIEYQTLYKLMNVLQRNSLNVYVYLFSRYCAAGYNEVIVTMSQIKKHIGIATTTTSNNCFIDDTIEVLKRLKLLDMEIVRQDEKTYMKFNWVSNKLPNM